MAEGGHAHPAPLAPATESPDGGLEKIASRSTGSPQRLRPHFLGRVWRTMGDRNISLASAGVAFFALFSLFPALTTLVSLFGFFVDPTVMEAQLDLLSEFLPNDAFDLIARQLASLVCENDDSLGIAALVPQALALWSARLGVGALLMGLKPAYGVPDRSGVRHLIVAFLLTGILIPMAIAAIAAIVILPQ